MTMKQRFKPGDHVIAPSIYVLTKQSSSEPKFSHATIIFAHPQFNWCAFKYDDSKVTASTFNENVFYEDEFKEHMEMLARQAEEERERREREENGDFDELDDEKDGDPYDDEPTDFDEDEDYDELDALRTDTDDE